MPSYAEPAESLDALNLRQRLDRIFDETWKTGDTYETRWDAIGTYLRPTRYRWTQSDADRGDRSFDKILSPAIMRASNIARAGLLAGLANPARPWFMYGLEDRDPDPPLAIVEWLTDFRDITLDVMRRSNFYTALEACFGDDLDFGTGAFGIYEHHEKVIHCHDFPIGSYRLANDEFGRCNTFARKVVMSVGQIVRKFGLAAVSDRVRDQWNNGQRQQTSTVRHLVAPNDGGYKERGALAQNLPYKECYWEEGSGGGPDAERVLFETGYHEFPVITSRWMRSDEDTYGVICPGIEALSLAKRLFNMERVGLNALEKEVDPPLKAPTSLMNRPISLASGDITYYDPLQGNQGPEKLHDIQLRLDYLWQKIALTESQIDACYMVDLFLATINDARSQRPTATEERARQREKLQVLGPVHERKAPETLSPSIDRVAAIMIRASAGAWMAGEDGLIPLPPKELQGRRWRVEYISEVAQAQKLIGLDALERHLTFGVTTAQATGDPSVLDNIDFDDAMEQHADIVGVSPTIRRSEAERAAIRQKRSQDMAAQQAVEAAPGLAGAARDLSQAQTDTPSVLNNLLTRAGV